MIETGAPTGFSNDNSTAVTKTVTQNAKCTDSTIATEATLMTATDKPLTNLTVTASSVLAGATNSRITCIVDGTTTNIGNSPVPSATTFADPVTMNANTAITRLKPGTHDCTVIIDP